MSLLLILFRCLYASAHVTRHSHHSSINFLSSAKQLVVLVPYHVDHQLIPYSFEITLILHLLYLDGSQHQSVSEMVIIAASGRAKYHFSQSLPFCEQWFKHRESILASEYLLSYIS